MTKPYEHWTVQPHGKLVQLDDNLFEVAGVIKMPLGEIMRRMTIVRLATGALVIYSAIALDATEMRKLESLGLPAYLIVPNDIHRLDAKAWKERYPFLKVIAPPGAKDKVSEVVPVDATFVDFGDHNVQYMNVPGTEDHEAALVVRSANGGNSLILNDIIFNLGEKKGAFGWLMKLMGMTGDEPKIPGLIKLRAVKDKDALSSMLETWSHLPSLQRIIVSHGKIIDHDAADVLHRVATELAA